MFCFYLLVLVLDENVSFHRLRDHGTCLGELIRVILRHLDPSKLTWQSKEGRGLPPVDDVTSDATQVLAATKRKSQRAQGLLQSHLELPSYNSQVEMGFGRQRQDHGRGTRTPRSERSAATCFPFPKSS